MIRFPDLLSIFMEYISDHGFSLIGYMLKYAGIPICIASFLSSMPASPLKEPSIITLAQFTIDDHIWLIAGIAFFTFLGLMLAISTASSFTLHCLIHGEKPDDAKLRELIQSSFVSISTIGFLVVFTSTIGIILCVFPGIYIMSASTVMIPILLHERCSPLQAIQSGIQLIRNHALKPFAFSLFIFIVASLCITAIEYVMDLAIIPIHEQLGRISLMVTACLRMLGIGMIFAFGTILYIELTSNKAMSHGNALNN